jgi:hypothetical protein
VKKNNTSSKLVSSSSLFSIKGKADDDKKYHCCQNNATTLNSSNYFYLQKYVKNYYENKKNETLESGEPVKKSNVLDIVVPQYEYSVTSEFSSPILTTESHNQDTKYPTLLSYAAEKAQENDVIEDRMHYVPSETPSSVASSNNSIVLIEDDNTENDNRKLVPNFQTLGVKFQKSVEKLILLESSNKDTKQSFEESKILEISISPLEYSDLFSKPINESSNIKNESKELLIENCTNLAAKSFNTSSIKTNEEKSAREPIQSLFPFPFLIPTPTISDFGKLSFNKQNNTSLPFSTLLYDDVIGFAFLLIEVILGKKIDASLLCHKEIDRVFDNEKDFSVYNTNSDNSRFFENNNNSLDSVKLNEEEKLFASTFFPTSPTFSEVLNSTVSPYSVFTSDMCILEYVYKNFCSKIPFSFLRFSFILFSVFYFIFIY